MAKRTVKARTRTAQPAKRSKAGARKASPKKKTAAAAKKPAEKAAKKRARKAPAKKTPPKKAPATRARAVAKKTVARKPAVKKAVAKTPVAKKTTPKTVKRTAKKTAPKSQLSSIEARRRELEETVPSPPSSLDLKRRGSAARTGRDEMAEHRADHATMTPSITGGDVDANVEDAYFTGDEAPGGDNPTPDQDIVDEIGKALGVEYQDSEELQGANKIEERDKHRWELDPASAEDYRDRDRE